MPKPRPCPSPVRAQAPFNDELIGYFAQALEAMDDAPLDDLVHEAETFDADRAREIEQLHLSTQSDYRAIFAREMTTGALAGYTPCVFPKRNLHSRNRATR